MLGDSDTIDIKGLHNTVSIDRASLASETQRTLNATTQIGGTAEIDNQLPMEGEGNLIGYVVDKIVAHRRKK